MTTPTSDGWTIATVLTYLSDLIALNDKRYEQRFSDLEALFTHRFEAQEKAVQAALTAADRAVNKAELGAEKRFEGVNEFRSALADQQRSLMPRSESEAHWSSLTKEVQDLKEQIIAMRDRSIGVRGGWGYAAGLIGLLVGITGAIMTAIALFSKAGG